MSSPGLQVKVTVKHCMHVFTVYKGTLDRRDNPVFETLLQFCTVCSFLNRSETVCVLRNMLVMVCNSSSYGSKGLREFKSVH